MTYNGEQTGGEGGDKIFVRSSGDDGVVSTAHCRPVVGGNNQAALNIGRRVVG